MNIYLTDSDEAKMHFGKDHKELYKKTTSTLKTRPGRNAHERVLPEIVSCLSKCVKQV